MHPKEPGESLSIGAFSRRSRLSPKALRLYDRLGLLRPDRVDEDTGYRWYRADQVARARLVALLRQLDMPLARIAELVELPGPRAADELAVYWAGVEQRVAAQKALALHLRERLSGRSPAVDGRFEIATREEAEQTVLTETRHLLAHELPPWIGESLGRLEKAARECGGIAGAPQVLYHSEVSMESDGPAEACVPVADAAAARAWAEAHGGRGSVTVRTEPAHRLVYTRITKTQVAHPQILSAYEAVERWIGEQGLRTTGPCREIYLPVDWDAAGPDDEVCDIAWPVA
ncbi:MerR family transcriptional regulator [Streptomyces sp. GC420]|uniref:MerR family transcriptional regulator n=1 Tax=Streptomyces sp. GC420 TaxID=2697568 RepID=UPI001414EA5B|nr:MerR family transcriptional regulator [Streptomyces sp. GC420]NBM14573.1 MerR family transcriptional regulator [Streptomyces sp. GC420]